MNTQFEKKKLYAYLGEDLVEDLKAYNAIIAGGTITSLFSNNEINDIDVYFRSEEDTIAFVEQVWNDQRHVVSCTNKALQFMYEDVNVQVIHFEYFKNAYDIFKTFDFTACMGAYDFKKEKFILHNEFVKHNSQRLLKFNSNTAFPIVSLLRVQKYKEKGYTISKPEFIRIVLTCMKLEINTYEELKDQLGGMYGVNLDKLFEDVDEGNFNLQDALDVIADITLSDEYFEKPKPVDFDSLQDLIESIKKVKFKAVRLDGKVYKILDDGSYRKTSMEHLAEIIPINEHFKDTKIYKFVNKKADGLYSFWSSDFKYEVGKEVIAKKTESGFFENGKLYFNNKKDIKSSSYYYESKKVLIEAEFNPNDVLSINKTGVQVSKAIIVREVPEKEWNEWVK